MTWKLWLDDVRNPKIHARLEYYQEWEEEKYIWALNTVQAVYYVLMWGPPEFMALDHDLGGSETTIDFLKWLQEKYPDCPPGYACHTANPVGRENMISFMESWKKSLDL